MKLVSGDRIWIKEVPIPHQYPYLHEDAECDVVVVGAGITGALCAYYLTEAGIKTILVDRNIIGYSSTSASTSILRYEVDIDLTGLRSLIGLSKAARSFKLNEKAVNDLHDIVDKIDSKCGFEFRESLYYTYKPSHVHNIREEYILRKEYGFDVEFLDRKTATSMFSFAIDAGILSKSGSAQVNPYTLTHDLISYSIGKGLSVFENTGIAEIRNLGKSILLETFIGKRIKAKKAIISTGYEGANYTDKVATFSRTFTIVTKPVTDFEGWRNKCIIRDDQPNYNYFRTTPDDRIIIGGEDVDIGGRNSKIARLEDMEQFVDDRFSLLENKLKKHFPDIQDLETEYRFTGIFGVTKDGLPYIGEYKNFPNCYFCLCYGANGILYAVLGAQFIRDMYLGDHPQDVELFRFGR